RFPEPGAATFEAAGLRWLRQAGGARVAEVISAGPGRLELERIDTGAPTPEAAFAFGSALARTHAAGADHFGYLPGDAPGYIGQVPLPLPPASEPAPTWGEFYARHRVLPFLRTAVEQGRIGHDKEKLIRAVADRLIAGELEHEQPVLTGRVARLHGDLWNGNVLWDARQGEAVLIDPAAHGGHAETDLAMLALFGQPFLDEILRGYQERSPLAEDWQQRVALHQLHPL